MILFGNIWQCTSPVRLVGIADDSGYGYGMSYATFVNNQEVLSVYFMLINCSVSTSTCTIKYVTLNMLEPFCNRLMPAFTYICAWFFQRSKHPTKVHIWGGVGSRTSIKQHILKLKEHKLTMPLLNSWREYIQRVTGLSSIIILHKFGDMQWSSWQRKFS